MKKLFSIIIAVLVLAAALVGCAGKNKPDDVTQPPETAVPVTPEIKVTEEMALEGVRSYLRSLGLVGAEPDPSSAEPEMGEGNDAEYQVVFRGGLAKLMYFYVEKTSGATRIVEQNRELGTETEAGTFDLFDYYGKVITPEPTEEPTAAPKTRFVFQPKVCSVYMEEVFGKTMCETWYNLVDAVMAGEDTFACPDKHTYEWVMGQFPRLCFPVLTEIIDLAYDRNNPVIDGVASFTYLVPREEAAQMIQEFAEQIEGILNETMESDYSDVEKALALYDYFARTYEYDYETFDKMSETYVDYTTTYRLFKTGIGICGEIAPAYSYLLMQAGVEATIMMGNNHAWSYIRINGHDYHIDPTFVIENQGTLTYFMMTDEQREVHGCSKDEFTITSYYSADNPHPDYTADDNTFSRIWEYQFEEFDPDKNILRCWQYTEGWEKIYLDFDYTGY